MKQLKIITCQPNDLYFLWQLRVQLYNLHKYGLSDIYTALVWHHDGRAGNKTFHEEWSKLAQDYPEANIVFYRDDSGGLKDMMQKFHYIPLLRPWLLQKYFTDVPTLKDNAILYIDSDVIFTKKPDFSRLLDDDICYLSDTKSYIAASYFDSKVKDVLPDWVEAYKQHDILQGLLDHFQLTRKQAEDRESGSGGAQYLLKNIDAQFWQDVFAGCIRVRTYLQSINRRFFESEDKGFQSWCSDMWSVLFTLWRTDKVTECPKEMDFCWATDPISRWDEVQIYHDAGAHTREIAPGHQLFLKREMKYLNNEGTPFEDDLSFVSKDYCSRNYVKEIIEATPYIYIEGIDPFKVMDVNNAGVVSIFEK